MAGNYHSAIESALLSLRELFSDTVPEVLSGSVSELQVVRLGRGGILMTQGDPVGRMYAIVSRRLQLFAGAGNGSANGRAKTPVGSGS